VARLKELGAEQWPKDSAIVELFCGRGNGLHALQQLGFSQVEGVDLSPRLLAQYHGNRADYGCRLPRIALRRQNQGCGDRAGRTAPPAYAARRSGSHLRGNSSRTETRWASEFRGAVVDTLFCGWFTPFCENPLARKCSAKLDALATMIDYERRTYEQWLTQPELVLSVAENIFPQNSSLSSGESGGLWERPSGNG